MPERPIWGLIYSQEKVHFPDATKCDLPEVDGSWANTVPLESGGSFLSECRGDLSKGCKSHSTCSVSIASLLLHKRVGHPATHFLRGQPGPTARPWQIPEQSSQWAGPNCGELSLDLSGAGGHSPLCLGASPLAAKSIKRRKGTSGRPGQGS